MSPAAIYRRRLCLRVWEERSFFKIFLFFWVFWLNGRNQLITTGLSWTRVCVCGAVHTAGPIDRLAALASVGG